MKNIMITWFVFLAALFVASQAHAEGRVLLVHSYYSDYPWVNDITEGVKKGLRGSGAQLEIFYMDTKRKTGEEWKVKSGEAAKQKVSEYKPDIVIPADDNAQQYFAMDYVGKEGIDIVFTGVNADPAKYGFPAANATGVIQKAIFAETVGMLLKIKPDVEKIAVISDDGPTSTAILDYMKTLRDKLPKNQAGKPVRVVSFDQPVTFDEWKALIKKYQTEADAIAVNLYQTVKASVGSKSLPQKSVMEWTMENNKLPTAGFFPDAFEDGVLCGIAESGKVQGYEAAKIAAEILKGKKPSDFEIVIPTTGIVMINAKTAEKLGLPIPFELLESADRVIE